MRIQNLQGKKCFVTGAAGGIGRAVAVAAAAEGANLFLTDVNAAQLEGVAADIRGRGGRVGHVHAMDISDFEAVRELASAIHAHHGSMDVVMNVAGISVWGAIEKLEHRHWKRCVDVNLMGPIHVMECFIPQMIRAGRGGHLVNVSSAAGLFGLPWHAAYSASKFGLRGVSEVLRYDLARHRIHVSLVCPGGVDTGLVDTLEIVGVERSERWRGAHKREFRKYAVTPEKAAAAILAGIKANRYLIFTSRDIAVGYWFQRKFAWPYELAMRLLNDRLDAALNRPRVRAPQSQA
jgi:NAD(P)-dependent dehydrogenase (short-subunit alcohol dehydrogenase family)